MNKRILIAGIVAVASLFLATEFAISKFKNGFPPPFDTAAPVITKVKAKKITSTGVNIGWFTSQPTTNKVYYSMTTPVVFNTATIVSDEGNEDCDEVRHKKFRHTIPLANLLPNTTYYFIVESTDISNNSSSSTEMSFTTKKAHDNKELNQEDESDKEDKELKCKPIKFR